MPRTKTTARKIRPVEPECGKCLNKIYFMIMPVIALDLRRIKWITPSYNGDHIDKYFIIIVGILLSVALFCNTKLMTTQFI